MASSTAAPLLPKGARLLPEIWGRAQTVQGGGDTVSVSNQSSRGAGREVQSPAPSLADPGLGIPPLHSSQAQEQVQISRRSRIPPGHWEGAAP